MKRVLFVMSLVLLGVLGVCAQGQGPVSWRATARLTSGNSGVITIKASIDKGWHLYSTDLPDGGPKATSFNLAGCEGMKITGKVSTKDKLITNDDSTFGMRLSYWEGSVTFTVPFKLTVKDRSKAKAVVEVGFMACNDENCTPPRKVTVTSAVLPAKKK